MYRINIDTIINDNVYTFLDLYNNNFINILFRYLKLMVLVVFDNMFEL